ncbi:hypothetical protein E4U53_007040 [Claviceps sorghi]|nr:hypothetical protein E4U53_007040 [Claviceps sorghi]
MRVAVPRAPASAGDASPHPTTAKNTNTPRTAVNKHNGGAAVRLEPIPILWRRLIGHGVDKMDNRTARDPAVSCAPQATASKIKMQDALES